MARSEAALELRVLAGPQAGARAPLARGSACRIVAGPAGALPAASGPTPDVVLNHEQDLVLQLDWPFGAEAAVRCQLESGVPGSLGETALVVGAAQPWPMCQPLAVGQLVLGWGPADEPDWSADRAAAPAQAPAPAAPPAHASLQRWLLTGGAALALGCTGLLVGAELLLPAQAGVALAGAPGPVLPLAPGRGAVPADAQSRAHDVAEVFRLHGVAAQAQAGADGSVAVTAKERDVWRVEQAEKAARRDVPGLTSLTVSNQPPPVAAGPQAPLTPDVGKRITAVVDNVETPYFVTADGSRYFIGAMLPSGHRVLQIATQAVTVERGGHMTRLTL